MRRGLALALCLLLLSGCGGGPEPSEGSYALYFQERDLRHAAGDGALRAEWVQLPEAEELSGSALAAALLEALLAGPGDETLKSAVPAGTSLLSLTLEGSQATVDLSSPYGTLSGVALTLADQAVVLTLTQLPEVLSVKITVRGRELAYRSKQVLTARDVLSAPEGDVVGTVDATLYFLDEAGTLAAEERTLEIYEGDTQVGVVARALENGPADSALSPVFPENFRPRSVWLEENICYVNLSSAMLELLPENAAMGTALESLRRSLRSLEAVEEICFLVDGEFTDYYGSIRLASYMP